MTHLDPDPLYIADDEEPWRIDYLEERPSLTVPLVLLCAVLTVLVAVWWIRG